MSETPAPAQGECAVGFLDGGSERALDSLPVSHDPASRKTPLHAAHLKLKARMVDFHGWIMPIQYAGIVEEHAAVRTRAGLFDLSHMGRVRVAGPARRDALQRLLTIDLGKVRPGRCR